VKVKPLAWAALILAAALGAWTAMAGEAPPWSRWSHAADVSAAAGMADLDLPPAILARATEDLSDLRLADDATGVEVPYVIEPARVTPRRVEISARLYNHAYLPGKQTSVVADFGQTFLKDSVEVRTGGVNYRRRVQIEGGDDGQRWQMVRQGALLFQVAGSPPFERFVVTMPENNFRCLRVTVFNGPGDPPRLAVTDVRARRFETPPAPLDAVSPAQTTTAEQPREKETWVTVDAGAPNQRLALARLGVSDPNFWRRVTVWGRRAESEVVKVRREDGAEIEKRRDVPWSPLGADWIYRIEDDQSLDVALGDVNFRHLQFRIQNQDDRPLTVADVKLFRRPMHVIFQTQAGASYRLYVGNPRAERPRYDLARFADRLKEQGVAAARCGTLAPNPGYHAEAKEKHWSERYAGLLWIGLLAALVVLACVVWRQVRSAGQDAARGE
jgi:hypothetical protein